MRPDPVIEKKFKGDLIWVWKGRIWFDDELISIYLDKTFGAISFKQLLVWDSFRCHISAKTKKKLQSIKMDMVLVPGGTTKFIQPANVCWNHPFKSRSRQLYEEWMLAGDHEKTKTGNLKAPPMEVYLQWIVDSWKARPKEFLEKSLKTNRVTNDVNGSEDVQIGCFSKDGPIPTGFSKLSNTRLDDSCAELLEQIDLHEDENNEFNNSDASIM